MTTCSVSSKVIGGFNADVIRLLEDVREYMLDTQTADLRVLAVDERMAVFKARSALTLQLTAIAAWGLYQAALLAGDEIPDGMRPDPVPDAMTGLADLPSLPAAFLDLLERSDALFRKVMELQAEIPDP